LTATICRSAEIQRYYAAGKSQTEDRGIWVSYLVINGHDLDEIREALEIQDPDGRPMCIIANTIKGKGLYCAENKAECTIKHPVRNRLSK